MPIRHMVEYLQAFRHAFSAWFYWLLTFKINNFYFIYYLILPVQKSSLLDFLGAWNSWEISYLISKSIYEVCIMKT